MKNYFVVLLALTIIMTGCNDLADSNTAGTKYSIIYYGNGNTYGYPPIDNNKYTSGSYATVLDKNTLQKTGHEFGGWNTKSDYSGTYYGSGDRIEIKNINISLHAVWSEIKKYTVTFETNGGSDIQSIKDIKYGEKISKPTNPQKSGSVFINWYKDIELTVEWDFNNNTVTENITLYAKWENNSKPIYQYEVTDIYHLRSGYTVFISWINPIDSNFSHVRIIPAGFEWSENFGDNSPLDKEPGINSYSMLDYANTEYVIIKCVGKDGTVSNGIKYYFNGNIEPSSVVTISEIMGVIKPVTGNIPVTSITETIEYTGTVKWSPIVSGTFADSIQYTATITITAKTGYTLQGISPDFFTVAEAIATNDVNSGVITAVFPQTIPSTFIIAPVLTLTERNESLLYSWTPSNPVADSYELYWLEGNNINSIQIKDGNKIVGAVTGGTINRLNNGTTYSVIITARKYGYTNIDSNIQTGTPKPPINAVVPIISNQPQGGTFFKIGTLSVSANVTDGGNLSYQWYRNNTNSTIGGTLINGAIGSSYVLSDIGTFYYYVIVSNIIANNNDGGIKTVSITSNVIEVSFDLVETLWAKSVNTATSSSTFYAITKDSQNNLYAAGVQFGNGSFTYGTGVSSTGASSLGNAVLVKYNSNGIAQWARSISTGNNHSRFLSVTVDNNGNIYVAGYQTGNGTYNYGNGVSIQGTSTNYENAILVKYDSNGTTQWARTVSTGNYNSQFNAVAVDVSGNVYTSGCQYSNVTYTYGTGVSAQGSGSGYNVVLVKYDSLGTALWAKTVSSGTYSVFNAVAIDTSNNVYVAGYQTGNDTYIYGNGVSTQGASTSYGNAILVKYDSNGTAQWVRSVTQWVGAINIGNNDSEFTSLAIDVTGNVFATGFQRNDGTFTYGTGVSVKGNGLDNDANSVLVKYDSNGIAQWAQIVNAGYISRGGSRHSVFSDVSVDAFGNIYVVGIQSGTTIYTYGSGVIAQNPNVNSGTSSNSVVVKYSSNGTALWTRTVNGAGGSAFNAIIIDTFDNIYAAGSQSGNSSCGYGNTITTQGAYGNGYSAVLVKYRN